MTVEEFLVEFEQTRGFGKTWTLDEAGQMVPDGDETHCAYTVSPLPISVENPSVIYKANDNRPSCDQAIRQRMLKAVGL